MIWEELTEPLILPSVEAQTSADVMSEVGGRLIQEGYAKSTYIDALVAREAEYPTGLDIDGVGIAIPHTDVSHVKKAGLAIARLNNHVRFIQMGTEDPVDVSLVFMLAVVDPKAHLELLQRIVTVIQDRKVLETLLECNDARAVIETIRAKEESL